MSYFKFIIFLLVIFTSNLSICYAQNHLPSLKGKNIIFVYGGSIHSPKESADFFVPILEAEGAKVCVFDNFSVYEDQNLMSETDLIIQAFTDFFTPVENRMNDKQFRGLQIAILNGTGFSGWHGGIGASNTVNQRYQFMVGGQFVSHPGGMTDYEVKIIDSIDAITQNIKDFTVKNTEQYYMLIDPNIKVLAVSEFKNETYQKSDKLKLEQINYLDIDVENDIKGSIMPVVWKKYYGNGRIFYSSIGHNLSDFDTSEVMNIQMRGFRWASEGKYREKKNIISPIFNE
jgi:type 1 glutamine amidotransferase